MRHLRRFRLTWRATGVILALLAWLLAGIVAASSPIPVIDQRFGDASLHFSADRAWALLPGECVNINWKVEGIESLHVEGRGEIGYGEKAFCPAIRDADARFALRTPDGLYREFDLRINFLPDLLFYLAGFMGVAASLGLAVYLAFFNRADKALNPRWVVICLAALVVIGTALRLNEPDPPRLDVDDGQVKAAIWAEQARLAFPQEAVDVEFSVAGAQRVRYMGEDVELEDGWAQRVFREAYGDAFTLYVTGADGIERVFKLPIPSLFGGLAQTPVWYYANLLALLAAAVLYLPFALRKARTKWRRRERADFAAAGCLALICLALYLPFGFDSVGLWEEWYIRQYFEGEFAHYSAEFAARPLALLPRAFARLWDSDSFIGGHLAQFFALVLQPTLLYGCLRNVGGGGRLHALLIAALCLAYPVNDQLMSQRMSHVNLSVAALLLAAYCALDYLRDGNRLALAGAALAAFYNVYMYETGMALLCVLPFLLWLRPGRRRWRRVNLAMIFFCAPALKASQIALMLATSRPFYRSDMLSPDSYRGAALMRQNPLYTIMDILPKVYERVFIAGWQDALDALSNLAWLPMTLLALVIAGAGAAYMVRAEPRIADVSLSSVARALAGGLLWIAAAVGVLMWLPVYTSGDMIFLYPYTTIGGAIVVFCLLLLVGRLAAPRWRDAVLIALCLLLMLPALMRLFAQHDGFTRIADAQARVLWRVLEAAPRPHRDSWLLLVTDMDTAELAQRKIPFPASTFADALDQLYEEHAPLDSWLCRQSGLCSVGRLGRSDWVRDAGLLNRAIVLELHRDLTVELIADPAARLDVDMDGDYDASRLFDADAPLPPRAHSMLGPAFRRGDG